VTNI